MSKVTDWDIVLVLVVGMLGIVLSFVLFFETKTKTLTSKFLAAFLLSISIVSTNFALTNTSFFVFFPHLWRIVGWLGFCTPVFSFLYVRSVMFPSKRLNPLYYLLFLPAFVYFCILIPLYLLPVSEKLIFINKALTDNAIIALEPDVMLPQGWGTLGKIYYSIIVMIVQFILLFKWSVQNVSTSNLFDKSVYVWVFVFTTVSSVTCVLLVIECFFHLSRYVDLSHQLMYCLSGLVFFVCLSLIVNPKLCYGANKKESDLTP